MATKDMSADKFATFATNTATRFENFSLKLNNGATLTGIIYVPNSGFFHSSPNKPLLIGIHGATCSGFNYDVSPEYTASLYSDLLGAPFVAIHRPNYLGTSGWIVDRASPNLRSPQFTVKEGAQYFEEEGRWFHEYIFPALWDAFGKPNGCGGIVTTSHSMSVPSTMVAAAQYTSQPRDERRYPFAGMVISGWAAIRTQVAEDANAGGAQQHDEARELPDGQDISIHTLPFEAEAKAMLMLSEGCSDPALRPLVQKQNTPLLTSEASGLRGPWQRVEEEYKAKIGIPVLFGLGEIEWLWAGTRENVNVYYRNFTMAPRVEGAVVKGAAHAIEWSYVAPEWWVKVFAWAQEVTSGLVAEKSGLKPFEAMSRPAEAYQQRP